MSHPDPIVAEVLDVWTPRFLVSGVYHSDLLWTAERIRTWEDWCPEWMRSAAMHEALAEQHLEEGHPESAAQAYGTASVYYHTAGFVSVRDVEQHREALCKMLETYERSIARTDPPVERLTIPSADGHLLALFTRPKHAVRPPVVVMIPGLDSTKEGRHRGREAFLRRGVAVMSVEGPG